MKKGQEFISTKKRNEAHRIARLQQERDGLAMRCERMWRELLADVSRPDFDKAMRAIHETEGRIETLDTRIASLRNGEPELGVAVDYYTIATQYQRK